MRGHNFIRKLKIALALALLSLSVLLFMVFVVGVENIDFSH